MSFTADFPFQQIWVWRLWRRTC